MPELVANGCRLFYSVEGGQDRPALVLSNALGTASRFWDPQAPLLAGKFRVVRYDVRGHGSSSAPAGEYTIEQLGQDVLAILDAERISRAHLCGLSLGGLTAMWLALHAPARVGKIVLANTAARIASRTFWQERIDLVMSQGLPSVAESAPPRWFTEAFRREHPSVVASCQKMLLECSPTGYAACAAALRDADLRQELGAISAPALVISGWFDPVTPPSDAAVLRGGIPRARGVELEAAHFSNIECATEFTNAVIDFLNHEGHEETRS